MYLSKSTCIGGSAPSRKQVSFRLYIELTIFSNKKKIPSATAEQSSLLSVIVTQGQGEKERSFLFLGAALQSVTKRRPRHRPR